MIQKILKCIKIFFQKVSEFTRIRLGCTTFPNGSQWHIVDFPLAYTLI